MKRTLIELGIMIACILAMFWVVRWQPAAVECRAKGGTSYPPCQKVTTERVP